MIANRLDLQWGNLVVGYKPEIDDGLGWCVLKRRPRAYAPDETILQDRPVGSTLGNSVPFKEWWPNMYRINPPKEGEEISAEMKWWLIFESEKFNNDQDPEHREIDPNKPINIRLTGDGGNLKAFYKSTQTATHIQLVAYDYRYPELANNDTFETAPHKIGLCSAINESGRVFRIAGGIDPYYFQVCRFDSVTKLPMLWVEKSKVIMLDQKPAVWTKADVMKRWI